MKPIMQTILTGRLANCFQASLASIFEMEIAQVPNFNEIRDADWEIAYHKWLEERGFAVIYCYEAGFSKARTSKIFGYHLITVHSPRGNFLHSLVGLNGVPVHDPFPGGNCHHNGIYSYEFFIPIMNVGNSHDLDGCE